MNVEECIRKGFLKRIKSGRDIVEKEFLESENDLAAASEELKKGGHKWSIVKSYYSMFHAARGVIFSMGLKERRHFAVHVVLEELVKKGKLQSIYPDYFAAAMEAREAADYRYVYSEAAAQRMRGNAEEFLAMMRKLAE